jgi:hypothetical protein
MIIAGEGRVIPQIEIVKPNGTIAQFVLSTEADKGIANSSGNPGTATLEDIERAKAFIALDASDGKLDLKVNGLNLEPPRYTIFWSNNSAANLMRSLAAGGRTLRYNGRDVEVTPAFKQFVESTQFLERVELPGRG